MLTLKTRVSNLRIASVTPSACDVFFYCALLLRAVTVVNVFFLFDGLSVFIFRRCCLTKHYRFPLKHMKSTASKENAINAGNGSNHKSTTSSANILRFIDFIGVTFDNADVGFIPQTPIPKKKATVSGRTKAQRGMRKSLSNLLFKMKKL